MNEKDQKEFWKDESLKYFERNYKGKDIRSLPPNPLIEQILTPPLDLTAGCKILEIGCGAANNLSYLHKIFSAKRCVGTEPSEEVIKILCTQFSELEFVCCDSSHLCFESDEFDLVVIRSVLHWIDRNYILQTLGEAIRCCKKYLIISDFSPVNKYSVVYHHNSTYRTYKMDYQHLIEGTGYMRCIKSFYSNADNEWKAIKTALYEKIPFSKSFPLKIEKDFH